MKKGWEEKTVWQGRGNRSERKEEWGQWWKCWVTEPDSNVSWEILRTLSIHLLWIPLPFILSAPHSVYSIAHSSCESHFLSSQVTDTQMRTIRKLHLSSRKQMYPRAGTVFIHSFQTTRKEYSHLCVYIHLFCLPSGSDWLCQWNWLC